jgi:elongation factor P--(R)-beta-lysine ligase
MKTLERRALMLRQLRHFFDQRAFLEVETPLLASEVIPELHIEPMIASAKAGASCSAATVRSGGALFLQASPEAHMKRLLAAGAEAIYQVTRSFRAGEHGPHHHPEFTLCEWYRTGDTMQEGIDLVDHLCRELLGTGPIVRTSYADAFERYAGISPHTASCQQLASRAKELSIDVPVGIDGGNRDEWLQWIMAARVEPELGSKEPEVLVDWPVGQAALATIRSLPDGTPVASRFELYWRGVELANGYHELTCAVELRARLQQVNRERKEDRRPPLPLPERLLETMRSGLPACTGCALGFDRLLMLACGADSIAQVMACPE